MVEALTEPLLEEITDQFFVSDLKPEIRQQIKDLAFARMSRSAIRDTLLDASTTLDTHAPLGGFTHAGYRGQHVTIKHRHSLLGWRVHGNIEDGNYVHALFAASMYDFLRNNHLANLAIAAANSEDFSVADLAIRAMHHDDRTGDADKERAVVFYNQAYYKQLELPVH